jgi:hypothetical protein
MTHPPLVPPSGIHPADDHARTLADATACWLSAGARSAGTLGLGCAALAATALLLLPLPLPARAAALAPPALLPAERVLALRLHFDAGLFAGLAGNRLSPPQALGSLDLALQALRLRGPSTASTLRPLSERVRGAHRLLAWHAACVGLQAVCALALLLTRSPA